MAEFFVSQLDFILFFYGLAFILLGSVCLAVARAESSVIAWRLLGIFGYLHGVGEWLDLSALIFEDTPLFALMRTGVMTVSYVALFEFGRHELARLFPRMPGPWIQIPLLALPALGWCLAGTDGANVLARYALGLTGSAITSFVLFASAKAASRGERRWLYCAAASFALYGIAAGAIVPSVQGWEGDYFNYDDFTQLTHMPIQFVRGLLACFVAFSVWAYWGERLIIDIASARYSKFQRRQFSWTLAALGVILVAGWVLTQYLGDIYARNVEEESAGDLNLIFSRLSRETTVIDGMVKALADADAIVASSGQSGFSAANALLRLETEAAGANSGIILDRSGAVIASTAAGDPNGVPNFDAAPYVAEAIAGRNGYAFAAESPSAPLHYYASHPIRNRRGDVAGVAVLEKSLAGLASDLHDFDRSFALVDKDGVVLLTNRAAMQYRTLWPLPPVRSAELRQKYGALNERPVTAHEIARSSWIKFNGNRAYVERRALPHGAWTLVTWKPLQGIFASRVLGIVITLQMTILALVYLVGRERWIHDHIQLERRLELEELARNLDFRATTDPLTGLFNRRKFDRALATEIIRAQRYKLPLSLILYDIDHFKQINDAHGHKVGDNVLTALSRFVAARIRNSDLLARWGGEEFVILCPSTNGAMACQLAGNLCEAVRNLQIGDAGSVTCSFGVAQYEDGDTAETLLARADDALYAAKSNGRNTVELSIAPPVTSGPALQRVG